MMTTNRVRLRLNFRGSLGQALCHCFVLSTHHGGHLVRLEHTFSNWSFAWCPPQVAQVAGSFSVVCWFLGQPKLPHTREASQFVRGDGSDAQALGVQVHPGQATNRWWLPLGGAVSNEEVAPLLA